MKMTQQALLRKISEQQFVCVELALYLDTHPDDAAAKADYYCHGNILRELMCEYQSVYGPLMNFGHSPTQAGSYVMGEWPWEV